MDQQENIKKTGNIVLNSNSKNEFFLIHGYTGSPGSFGNFPKFLNKKLNSQVNAVTLRGHETSVEDLLPLEYSDFFSQLEKELKEELKKGKKIFLGGYSFGAQLALDLASKYPVSGLFLFSIPYKLRFPWNLPFLEKILSFKKTFKKNKSVIELHNLEQCFHYPIMPVKGGYLVKFANRKIEKTLNKVTCPIIIFHFSNDLFGKKSSVEEILSKVSSKLKKGVYINQRGHNPFFSSQKLFIFDEVNKFFKRI